MESSVDLTEMKTLPRVVHFHEK